jgi:predicted ester cyclase
MSYARNVMTIDSQRHTDRSVQGHGEPGADVKAICRHGIKVMANGSLADFEAVYHPDFVNHEAIHEPLECRSPDGPTAAYATACWLRHAFADLQWDIHQVIAEGELVSIYCTMHGRHVNTFVGYDEKASVKDAFPPTGRRFASTQTHWCRVADGKVIEHWANRDDMATALQLGWVPPTPLYLLRMAVAKWRARRARVTNR